VALIDSAARLYQWRPYQEIPFVRLSALGDPAPLRELLDMERLQNSRRRVPGATETLPRLSTLHSFSSNGRLNGYPSYSAVFRSMRWFFATCADFDLFFDLTIGANAVRCLSSGRNTTKIDCARKGRIDMFVTLC